MSLSISPLFSSSSGNCTYIESDQTSLLIDAGMAGGTLERAICDIGKKPGDLAAILITHEHMDHIKGAGVLSRKYDIPIYANAPTWECMEKKIGEIPSRNIRLIDDGEFFIRDICVQSVPLSHDAAKPVGYALAAKGRKVGVLTDTGRITGGMLDAYEGSAIVLLESNHDVDMLRGGRYPYYLKSRILSNKGHLSNADAACYAIELVKRGIKGILLGHISRENNHKKLAYDTTCAALRDQGICVGKDVALAAARRSCVTGYYTLK